MNTIHNQLMTRNYDRTKILKAFSTIAIIVILVGGTSLFTPVMASGHTDITARKTNQNFILDGQASEAFWQDATPFTVDLTGTTTLGGSISRMTIRSAHDGANVFFVLQWADPIEVRSGTSRASRIALSTPGNLTGGYAYNDTHYYPDDGLLTWWLGPNEPTVMPAVNNEFGGSGTRRTTLFGWGEDDAAESWTWKSTALDEGNPNWPDANIDAAGTTWHWGDNAGTPFEMPHSAAYQGHWSANGNLIFGDGLLHAEGCQIPGTLPFEVHARGVWSSGVWTLEIQRSLISAHAEGLTTDFVLGETYWVTVGAQDGNSGEWEEVASASDWLSFSLSNELLPTEKLAAENQVKIDAANSVANQANAAADDAVEAANDANTSADQAKSVANQANTVAQEALGEAGEAKDTAAGAEKTANEAQTIAESNEMALQIAQAAADNALQAADDAQTAADSANMLTYAAIGIAVIAIAITVVIQVKKK